MTELVDQLLQLLKTARGHLQRELSVGSLVGAAIVPTQPLTSPSEIRHGFPPGTFNPHSSADITAVGARLSSRQPTTPQLRTGRARCEARSNLGEK
jgi:hypothetical protein